MKVAENFLKGLWQGKYDKTSHFIIAAAISIAARLFFSWQAVVIIIIIVSVLKESYDYLVRRQKFDWLDIMTNFLAMLTVLLVFYYFE